MGPGFLVVNLGQRSAKLGGTEVKSSGNGQGSSTNGMPLSQAAVAEAVSFTPGKKVNFLRSLPPHTVGSTLNVGRPIKKRYRFC